MEMFCDSLLREDRLNIYWTSLMAWLGGNYPITPGVIEEKDKGPSGPGGRPRDKFRLTAQGMHITRDQIDALTPEQLPRNTNVVGMWTEYMCHSIDWNLRHYQDGARRKSMSHGGGIGADWMYGEALARGGQPPAKYTVILNGVYKYL